MKWTVKPLREDNPCFYKIVDETGSQVVPFTWEDKHDPQRFCDAHNSDSVPPLSAQVEGQTKALDGKEAVDSTTHVLQNLSELLRVAKCPNCDGSGAISVPLGEHFATHEMAMDAGEPSMEGSSMGIEWGAEQCQWCDERKTLLLSLDGVSSPVDGVSAESGSLVSVEAQTDEGLWTVEVGAHVHTLFDDHGRVLLQSTHEYLAERLRDCHNATLRAKSEKPQSSGKKEAPSDDVGAVLQNALHSIRFMLSEKPAWGYRDNYWWVTQSTYHQMERDRKTCVGLIDHVQCPQSFRGLSDPECLRIIGELVGKACDEDVIDAVERFLSSHSNAVGALPLSKNSSSSAAMESEKEKKDLGKPGGVESK